MVQDSLVDYINSQMKIGVSRDAIKATLTSAGWVAADVEDTLKKVEMAKTAEPAAGSVKPAATPGTGPQTIKVSDLISASAPTSVTPIAQGKPASGPLSKSPMSGPTAVSTTPATPMGSKPADTFKAASALTGMKMPGSRGTLITMIGLAVVIVLIGGFAGFLFMQNNDLNSKLSALNGQSSGVNSQLAALQAQMQASSSALTAQIASLNNTNQELQTELSFLVAPTGTAPAASSTAKISGIASAGKTSYVITTMYGVKINVANSKAASVIAALGPLTGSPATGTTATSTASSTRVAATSSAPIAPVTPVPAQFVGTYTPGSDMITLTSVNGTSL